MMNLRINTTVLLKLSSFVFLTAVMMVVPTISDSVIPGFINGGQVLAANNERRAPPTARSSQTLGRRMVGRINEVMELRDMELFDEALEILEEVREDYDRDRLNDREKFVMWQFYANIYQIQEKYDQAIEAYRQITLLPNMTQDQLEQAFFYLGSLYYIQELFPQAIDTFLEYNQMALEPNEDVYFRIGTAYYQMEDYPNAISPILKNMEIIRSKNETISKNTYDLLRAIYFNIEDYDSAYQILRESVVLYNDSDDWILLPAVLGQVERFAEQAQSYYVTDTLGYLDSESQLVNLAAQLYNNDYPYGCARIMEEGMSEGIIEEDEGNLSFLSTCYQIAREDAKAAPPLEKAAALSEGGENYARLGRVLMTLEEFDKAVDAFTMAFEKGDLERPDQVYLSLTRVYLELNRHDEGLETARAARTDERSEEAADTWIQHLTREKLRYETLQQQRIELAEYFR